MYSLMSFNTDDIIIVDLCERVHAIHFTFGAVSSFGHFWIQSQPFQSRKQSQCDTKHYFVTKCLCCLLCACRFLSAGIVNTDFNTTLDTKRFFCELCEFPRAKRCFRVHLEFAIDLVCSLTDIVFFFVSLLFFILVWKAIFYKAMVGVAVTFF